MPNKERITAVVPLDFGKYFKGYGDVREVDWFDDVSLPCQWWVQTDGLSGGTLVEPDRFST